MATEKSAPDRPRDPSPRFVDLINNPAALSLMLRDTGLLSADEPIKVTPLTGGVSSSIFRVELASGTYCVKQALPKLKVASDWRAPVERVFAEIDYLHYVNTTIADVVPPVLATHAASGAFVMPYLPPAHWHNWKGLLLTGRVSLATAQHIGYVLGRVHRTSAAQPELAARFANAANFMSLRLDPYLLETGRRLPALTTALQAIVARTESHTSVLLHGDVSPKNILVHADDPARIMLLDAECATWGDPAFDLAFLLNHCLLKAIHLPASRQELLAAFDTIIGSYRAQVDWEPWTDLAARAGPLLAGLMRARVDGKSPVEYLDDAAQHRVRVITEPLLLDGAATLVQLRAAVAGG